MLNENIFKTIFLSLICIVKGKHIIESILIIISVMKCCKK